MNSIIRAAARPCCPLRSTLRPSNSIRSSRSNRIDTIPMANNNTLVQYPNAAHSNNATPPSSSSSMMHHRHHNDPHHSKSMLFSTATKSKSKTKEQLHNNNGKKKKKKSPHSKLLRVCSERNVNAHFAAIEADLLRLNWQEAMAALVNDWTSPKQRRYDDLIELESNVRSYVTKNLIDLKRDLEKKQGRNNDDGGLQWKNDQWVEVQGSREEEDDHNSMIVSMVDELRFQYFPYQSIITSIVHSALGEDDVLSFSQRKEILLMASDDNGESSSSSSTRAQIHLAEIHERIRILDKAGKLLDAMSNFEDADAGAANDGRTVGAADLPDGAVGDAAAASDKEEMTENNKPKEKQLGKWTTHHESCSACHRTVLSGWFLLYRRLREANKRLLEASDTAADVLKMTKRLEVHPEEEAYVWAKRWMDFCTATVSSGAAERSSGDVVRDVVGEDDAGNVVGDDWWEDDEAAPSQTKRRGGGAGVGTNEKEVLLGGILPSDKALFLGVIRILSMSENDKRKIQAEELERRLNAMLLSDSDGEKDKLY